MFASSAAPGPHINSLAEMQHYQLNRGTSALKGSGRHCVQPPKNKLSLGNAARCRSAPFPSPPLQMDNPNIAGGVRERRDDEGLSPVPSSRKPAATYAKPSVTETGTLMPNAEWYPAWMRYRKREDNHVFWTDKFNRNSLNILRECTSFDLLARVLGERFRLN